MDPEEIEAILSQLTDPTTAPALAEALGYHPDSILVAIHQDRLPARKVGGVWLIPLDEYVKL
jgi:hypothetical protein